LYFPGETVGFLSTVKPKRSPPSWVNDLELSIQDSSVAVTYMNVDFGKIPLFLDGLLTVLGNWKNKNPLDRVSGQSGLTPRNHKECRNFLIAAIHDCGNCIRNRLLHVLKITEQPEFEIYCQPKGDVFGEEKKLPAVALIDVVGIDFFSNDLKDSLGLPKYSFVKIKQRKPSASKVGPRGSFREHDDVLVEKMKKLIDGGKAPNVRQAAIAVLRKAARRTVASGKRAASDESVLRRLQDRFSDKYPDYTNRKGQKSP